MGEYVIKTNRGYTASYPGNYTHYIMDQTEYTNMCAYCDELENTNKSYASANQGWADFCNEKDIEIQRLQEKIQTMEKEAEEKAAEMERMEYTLETAIGMAESSMRILRERANAKRGITPKKEHDGYVATKMVRGTMIKSVDKKILDEYITDSLVTVLFKPDRNSNVPAKISIKCWLTTIQSPYSITIREEIIEDIILKDMWHHTAEGSDGWLRDFMGANPEYEKDTDKHILYETEWNDRIEGHYCDSEGKMIEYIWPHNVILDYSLGANVAEGLWEITLYTREPLLIQDHRRPQKKKQEK